MRLRGPAPRRWSPASDSGLTRLYNRLFAKWRFIESTLDSADDRAVPSRPQRTPLPFNVRNGVSPGHSNSGKIEGLDLTGSKSGLRDLDFRPHSLLESSDFRFVSLVEDPFLCPLGLDETSG